MWYIRGVTVFETNQVTMINPRGRLTWVNQNELDLRKQQGWKIVVNPRRDYFPEYDIGSKGFNKNQPQPNLEIDDIANLLPYEEV